VTTPTLLVVIASTRPGRTGGPVGTWFQEFARADGRFAIDVVDLAELGLPFLDEPKHPRFRDYEHDHTRAWSARVQPADAVALVMPEYNYGYSAPLKNAIDFLYWEWAYKPVGFVSYGGVSGGLRAVQMIKQVVTTVHMMPLPEGVPIPYVRTLIRDGRFVPTPVIEEAAAAMLGELERWTAVLRPMRDQT
jgi:NAD(P)H-dependent FMN reductase